MPLTKTSSSSGHHCLPLQGKDSSRSMLSSLFRYGIRHWCRIASVQEKIMLVGILIIFGLSLVQLKIMLFGGRSNRNGDILAGLSYMERKSLEKMVKSFPSGQKVLLAWPTIPVAFKGSDSRPIDAIQTLTSMGFDVDLMFWHDYATEIQNDNYDDSQDRKRVIEAGVNRIMGPYMEMRQQQRKTVAGGGGSGQAAAAPPLPTSYSIFLYWLWPEGEWLLSLLELSSAVKRQNSQAGIIAAVDDRTISLRALQGALLNKKRSQEEVEELLLSLSPFHSSINNDAKDTEDERDGATAALASWDLVNDFDPSLLNDSRFFLNAELKLYEEANVVLGINDATLAFLEKLEPQLITQRLSYVSPVQPVQGLLTGTVQVTPFAKRTGYLFFGYDNSANNKGIKWFMEMVMPTLPLDETFHIAGTVQVPSEYCDCSSRTKGCKSHNPTKVTCHGPIDDDALDRLIRSVKLSVNPILETSGVSTKTCRSMALGTPVVVTSYDGTFTNNMVNVGGALRCPDNPSHNFAPCFHESVRTLLTDENTWRRSAYAGPTFISGEYGLTTYVRDWVSILGTLREEERHRVLIYDSNKDPSDIGKGTAWDIAKTISQFKDFDMTVLGQVHFSEEEDNTKIIRDENDPIQFLSIPKGESLSEKERKIQLRSFLRKTNVFISLSWPPEMVGNENTVRKVCSALWRCQVVQILPWELPYIDDSCMNKHLLSTLEDAARESILRPCK